MTTNEELARTYVAETQSWLDTNVGRIKHCLGQLNDEQVWWRPHESMNSIANLVLHICGNIRQRILATAGGQPDNRDRPSEFTERGPIPKDELIRRLDEVTGVAKEFLASLRTEQLIEPRRYRGLNWEFDGTVLSTILRSLLHFSGHTQEIVHITRLQLGDAYEFQMTPSTPDGGSPD
jgi:hypothetical protein